jgi:hypothetical protein
VEVVDVDVVVVVVIEEVSLLRVDPDEEGGGLVSLVLVVGRDLRVKTEEMRELKVGFGVGDSILKE